MILKELNPIVLILRYTGFWTYIKCRKNLGTRWFYTLFVWTLVLVNVSLFSFNIYGIQFYTRHNGFVNVETMSFVINGLKPLHAALNLVVFISNQHVHAEMVKEFLCIDDQFHNLFDYTYRIRHAKVKALCVASICFSIPFALRLSQYILQGEQFGTMWFSDVSLLLVPMLSLWQLLPLYYFYLANVLLRKWFSRLNRFLSKETDFETRSISDYVQTYQMLTKAVYTVGTFFNSFVFFSMGISLGVLCITIYYFTAISDIYKKSQKLDDVDLMNTYYFQLWTGLQILVAVTYMLVFCVCGWRTNEGARRIAPLLLSLSPSTVEHKYLVEQVMNKIYTQFNWGISIWRIVLFERSLLLTMISAIITYAMILVKLKPTPCDCNQQDLFNATTL